MTLRFAEDLTDEEIKKQIRQLLETKSFRELEALLGELRFRRRAFKRRIILEMSEIGELLQK